MDYQSSFLSCSENSFYSLAFSFRFTTNRIYSVVDLQSLLLDLQHIPRYYIRCSVFWTFYYLLYNIGYIASDSLYMTSIASRWFFDDWSYLLAGSSLAFSLLLFFYLVSLLLDLWQEPSSINTIVFMFLRIFCSWSFFLFHFFTSLKRRMETSFKELSLTLIYSLRLIISITLKL